MTLTKIRSWYGKYERPISSLSLIGGFVFDALTLKRVDLFWENFWVVAHLVIVAGCIVIINLIEKTEDSAANPGKAHFWLVNILQFFFGGLLSTFLVFYFRSGDVAQSWPFLLILAVSFGANEVLKRHFVRLYFQISQLFLSVFCFAIFVLPVIFHKIGGGMFLVSGGVSLFIIALFILLLRKITPQEFKKHQLILYLLVAGIFVGFNGLYFFNLIPPLPLSLKDAGVFHSVKKISSGNYAVLAEAQSFFDNFNLYPDIHYTTGESIYVYTAVFSPEDLDTKVIHQWQVLKDGNWTTQSQVNLAVSGGRDGGFRTYSLKRFGLTAGRWRVNVLTPGGQLVGRVRFKIVAAQNSSELKEEIK